MKWTPYCDRMPQPMYITGSESWKTQGSIPRIGISFLYRISRTNLSRISFLPKGYRGNLQRGKTVGTQKRNQWSYTRAPIRFHEVQGHYDYTFIAVNYKDDDLQYKDVTSNSNVTNWMRRSPFLTLIAYQMVKKHPSFNGTHTSY